MTDKKFADMTPAEQRQFERATFGTQPLIPPHADKRFDDMTAREKEEFERSIGRAPSWGEIIARRRQGSHRNS